MATKTVEVSAELAEALNTLKAFPQLMEKLTEKAANLATFVPSIEAMAELDYNSSTQSELSAMLNAYGVPIGGRSSKNEWDSTSVSHLLKTFFPDYIPNPKGFKSTNKKAEE